MTLDENFGLWEHCRDRDQAQLADLRRQEAEDRAQHRADLAERDACESPEAEEVMWFGKDGRGGIFRQSPPWRRDVHYELDAG